MSRNSAEIMKGLSMISQLALLLLIPILLGFGMGFLIDQRFGCDPWGVMIGGVLGVVSAFRNLYVWSRTQIAKAQFSERAMEARRFQGILSEEDRRKEKLRGK